MPDIVWKVPVEKDDVSLTGDSESLSQRKGIGKATDDKPMIRQLISDGLATVRVVLDVEDPDEVPPQFSYSLVCSSRFNVSRFILIHHRGSTFSAGACSTNPVLEWVGARPSGLRRCRPASVRFNSSPLATIRPIDNSNWR